jgi:hypothetical protein
MVTAHLIKRLPLVTTLEVEEPEELAKKKIGVYGQWIKVKDASGNVGYVAAWYIKADAIPDEGENGDEPLSLKTTAEGVALRRIPIIADHTLIKRLPDGSIVEALDADAESKVGVNGEWIKVRDSSGAEGYIAAWYVES